MEANLKTFLPQNMSLKVQPFSRDWIVSFKNPAELWTENWFALTLEVLSALIIFQVFRNVKRSNPQTAYLIPTAICAVLTFEILPLLPRPGYQLWWFHQGAVNVLKQRVPSYVVTVFALVYYMAHGLTSRTNLPALTRSLLTALCGSLIMFPCLWLASRLLLVFLHFDDPVFRDQFFGVPYIQLVVILLLLFHTSHLFHENYVSIEPQERNTYSYVKCALQSGVVSGIYALVEQYLLYILFKLNLRSHTAFCLIGAVAILMYLSKKELKAMQMTSYTVQGIISPLLRKELWIVFGALLLTSTLPLWLSIEDLRSSSDRLELGPCHITHDVSNTSPLEITRRRYVCPDDVSRVNFDFHCLAKKELSQGLKNKPKHYTICGKKLENPFHTFKVLATYSAVCMAVFYAVMLFSFTFKNREKEMAEGCKRID